MEEYAFIVSLEYLIVIFFEDESMKGDYIES